MFVDVEPDPEVPKPRDGFCWCSLTMTCLGPDGRVADEARCGAERRLLRGAVGGRWDRAGSSPGSLPSSSAASRRPPSRPWRRSPPPPPGTPEANKAARPPLPPGPGRRGSRRSRPGDRPRFRRPHAGGPEVRGPTRSATRSTAPASCSRASATPSTTCSPRATAWPPSTPSGPPARGPRRRQAGRGDRHHPLPDRRRQGPRDLDRQRPARALPPARLHDPAAEGGAV